MVNFFVRDMHRLHRNILSLVGLTLLSLTLYSCSSAPQTTEETPIKKDTVTVLLTPTQDVINGRRTLLSIPPVQEWTGYLLTATGDQWPLNLSVDGPILKDSATGNWSLTSYDAASHPRKSSGVLHLRFDTTVKQDLLLLFSERSGSQPVVARARMKERVKDAGDKAYLSPGYYVIELSSDSAQFTLANQSFRKLFLVNSREINP
jgi:hypothetical protein